LRRRFFSSVVTSAAPSIICAAGAGRRDARYSGSVWDDRDVQRRLEGQGPTFIKGHAGDFCKN